MVTVAGTPLALAEASATPLVVRADQLALMMKETAEPGETVQSWAERHGPWLEENARVLDERGYARRPPPRGGAR